MLAAGYAWNRGNQNRLAQFPDVVSEPDAMGAGFTRRIHTLDVIGGGGKTKKRTPFSMAEKLLLLAIIALVAIAVAGRVLAR